MGFYKLLRIICCKKVFEFYSNLIFKNNLNLLNINFSNNFIKS